MNSKKIASTPERAPATSTTDNTHIAQTEQTIVLNHLLKRHKIDCDLADEKYGIRHLHSIIPKLEAFIPVAREKINRPHPRTRKVREITRYWIALEHIVLYATKEGREQLKKQQLSANIAKSRASDNKAFSRLCSYCSYETMSAKLHEKYGISAANDSD